MKKSAFLLHGQETPLESLGRERLQELKDECMQRLAGMVSEGRKFSVIYADPPWTYDARSKSLEGCVPYPTMPLAELKELLIKQLAHLDCALFMWSTSALLPQAIDLYRHWKFEYKTVFRVWRKVSLNGGKPINGVGHWNRSCYEFLLVGTRGSGFLKHRKKNESQEITWASTGHSAKPPHARTAIENLNIPGPRLELFARGPTPPGWTAWGLEVQGFLSE